MILKVKEKSKIKNAEDVAKVIKAILSKFQPYEREKEHFFSIGLQTDSSIKYVDLVSTGTLNYTCVHPREVFRNAIKYACYSVIVAHNHVTDNVTPSEQDKATTEVLSKAGDYIQIKLLDHIIVSSTSNQYYSFTADSISELP